MEIQNTKLFLLVGALLIQLIKCNCNNNYYNEFVSKLRLKRDSTMHQYDNTNLQRLFLNMSFHKNLHSLPENAIYCTGPINSETAQYVFLHKYYAAIRGNPANYVNKLDCIYPRLIEFPDLDNDKPLTGVEKFQQALQLHIKNFGEFLDKLDRGEKPEPYKTMDVEALTDDIMNDIFHHKPDPLDALESSAPNGVICERLSFNETNREGLVVDVMRPICYPARKPPVPRTTTTLPTTRKYPTVRTVTKSNDSKFVDKACNILCYTGLIYQLLACCRH